MSYNMNDDLPAERPLKAYAFDPSSGRNLGNYMTINVRNEKLAPGPVGEYIEVIDYDSSNNVYYDPVNLDDAKVMLRGGLDPSESDPRFHQQMVYAVASETIRRFEFALGRKARWRFSRARNPNERRLRMLPHAMQEANAFYAQDLRAIVFGYFPASETDPGDNLPRQTVFTCLSHDIVVHETTHALIDGQREYFLEDTSPDTPAFHEGFADIIALFQHFSYKEALIEMIQRTGGLIYRLKVRPEVQPGDGGAVIQDELSTSNPLVQLAQQFGEAMGMRAALRQALGTPPNSKALQTLFEAHDRGAILVAAVFDAFFSIYLRRTKDLIRIAQAGGTVITPGNLNSDLANRLATEAAKAAQHFANICIRALDYCPPVDILFGDFLRAMITADYDLVSNDKYGYRAALIEGFRLRGIRPEGVVSYAEESLRWCPPSVMKGITPPRCKGLIFEPFEPDVPNEKDLEAKRKRNSHNAARLNAFAEGNAKALGLNKGDVAPFSFHEVHRVGPDGRLKFEIVAELVQQMDVHLDPNDENSPRFTYRGGTTVVLSHEGEVRYAIQKSLGKDDPSNERLARVREYYQEVEAGMAMSGYVDGGIKNRLPRRGKRAPMNFSLIHRGY